jgi:hypothetical protein
MEEKDLNELLYAKELLENPSLASKLSDIVGYPIEKGITLFPDKWSKIVLEVTEKTLRQALNFAVVTMDNKKKASSEILHKVSVAASGLAGGAFGLPALGIELPVSTTIMLRSIADIARSEGENIKTMEVKMACLAVFALGGKSPDDDASETGYYFIRGILAREVSEVAKYITEKGVIEEAAPVIVRFITTIASRFGTTVSEKLAAQAVPVIGALGGGIVNTIFMDHFQDMARGHFIVRRLERNYGKDYVKDKYNSL